MSVWFSSSYFSSCHLWLLLVLALVHLCISDQNPNDVLCMDRERQALIQFKHGLIDETNRLSSWVGDKSDCCKWTGVVCDNITGHVHEIHLRGPDEISYDSSREFKEGFRQKLGGYLSPSLLELKKLKYLDLSCNDFKNNQIPSLIGSLKNLRYLNLSTSNFGGVIPHQIGNLSELRVLSLHMYGTRTMKLHWLSSLRWLHHLDISGIDLSKAIDWFQVINTLPSLVQLHMSYCRISDIHPYVSSLNATSLSVLDISGNHFENTSIPLWIFSQTSLVSLDLSLCNFDHHLPSSVYSFYNLTSLDSLYARGTYFMNSPSVLKGLSSNLKSLHISSCGISSSLLDSIHNMTSLVSLDLSRNQLTNAISKSFGNICNLREIDLSYNNFDDICLEYLLKSLFDCKTPSLESLSISLSGLSGPIPNSIGRLISLRRLSLFGNRLNGSIPYSIGQLSKLTYLEFSKNLLTGVVTEAHFVKLSSLKSLYGYGNNLTLKLQVANWNPPFQIHHLSLNSWGLGPRFPLWLQSQRDLILLDIRNTRISSPLPPESFWRSFPNLTILDISRNHIEGTLTLFFPTRLDSLDLSSNKFTGKLPSLSNGSLIPTYLDLSNNTFVGSLHNLLCSSGVEETEVLLLGYNRISGNILMCWEKWKSLRVLNLENNNISGDIPGTLGTLCNLIWLNMHGNNISGRIPSSMTSLTSLTFLQLGGNELVGSIPSWLGTKLTSLRILNLRSNNLDGNIPHELCYLSGIQILDLAHNKLFGNIPKCFNNFSVLSKKKTISDAESYISGELVSDTLVMKGQEYMYNTILGLVTLLDLSSNNFSGVIPSELTALRALKSLNLSRNQLTGRIPEKIGDMKTLESLDLSINKLFGELPISLSWLNFLSSFNVCYNNLTGRIPVSTQLQSFGESSFFSNKLCGAPLSNCTVPVEVEVPDDTIGDQKDDDVLEWGLVISIVLGFVTGFWIIVAPLIISTSWRIAYFRVMSKLIKVRRLRCYA